jgi:hypothetical protein
VENHISRSDEIPEVVALPAGAYMIEARSERDGYVRVPVVIKASGRLSIWMWQNRRHTDTCKPVIAWRVQAIRNFSILRKTCMYTEARSEFDASYNARVVKIRTAAAIALKELDELRLGGHITGETLDTEVARIAREKLHPYGCDLVVYRSDDGITRFLIEVQSTGKRYDLIKSFFHRDEAAKDFGNKIARHR